MKTYDIYFNDSENSNNKGFKLGKDDAIEKAEEMLQSKESYVSDYPGGTISVQDNEGLTVWTKEIE
jgi:hypothetical protein